MPPAEQCNGADKEELIALVKAKWAEASVDAEVLKMGINSTDWRRDTRWEYASKTWSKVDQSRIQGFVIVKAGDDMAVVHYINLVKDHMAGDKITAWNLDDPKAEPDVSQKLLLKNVQ